MTALKEYTLAVPEDIKKYYYTTDFPKTVKTVQAISEFSDVELLTKVKGIPVGTTIQIADIEFNKNGVPRFKTTDGTYVSAYKTKFE